MMLTTTSTAPLAAAGATGTIAITNTSVIAGAHSLSLYGDMPSLPVYGIASDGTKAGAFITMSQDFVGNFTLTRHTSAFGGDNPVQQVVGRYDQTFLEFASNAPFLNMTGFDAMTLTLTGRSSGSIMLTLVQ